MSRFAPPRRPLGILRLDPRGTPSCLALLLLALFGTACDGGADAEFEPPPVTVEVTRVESQLLRDTATFSGQLSAENSVTIKAETEGVIAEIAFEEGEDVPAGALLFRLKDDEQTARLNEAKATLALAQEIYARTQKLVTRDAASQAAKDAAVAERAIARARVELAQVELDRTEIRAPFDGVLGVRFVSPGDRVTDETPLVTIDAVDRLQVAFAISELGILFTRVGTPVEVSVAPYPGEVFPGKVFFVSPTLDPATRRIIAKAWVSNPDRRLRAGLFADVEMEIERRENAILVPESAIVFDRQGPYVWKILDDGTATRVPIEIGLRKNGRAEIKLGLSSGDTVVTAGTHKVTEGKRVAIAEPKRVSDTARRETGRGAGEGT